MTAMPCTPCATIDSIRAIWPSWSSPAAPWPVISSTSGWAAAHSLAASSMMKKKSTGNFVMSPSLMALGCGARTRGLAVAGGALAGAVAGRPGRAGPDDQASRPGYNRSDSVVSCAHLLFWGGVRVLPGRAIPPSVGPWRHRLNLHLPRSATRSAGGSPRSGSPRRRPARGA